MKSKHQNTTHTERDVESIKAKLESAKEELKKRYDATVDKIKEDLSHEEENAKDAWDALKSRF